MAWWIHFWHEISFWHDRIFCIFTRSLKTRLKLLNFEIECKKEWNVTYFLYYLIMHTLKWRAIVGYDVDTRHNNFFSGLVSVQTTLVIRDLFIPSFASYRSRNSIFEVPVSARRVCYLLYLDQACTTYGPRTKCGPQKLLIWPAQSQIIYILLVTLIKTPFECVKRY